MAQDLLLNPLHEQAGATLTPWQDWVVPWRFRSAQDEYRTVKDTAGLIDWSTTTVIEVRGADRVSFLHNLLTQDIKALTPGAGCRAALVTSSAKLLADLLVLADQETHWLLAHGTSATRIVETLQHYLITEDVTLHDLTSQSAMFAIQGPQSLSRVAERLGSPLALPHPLMHTRVQIDEVSVHVVRHSLINASGALVIVQAENAAWLWDRLRQTGGPGSIQPVGWEALEVLRIEAGIPWYGIDMDETNLLPETGLHAGTVSDTKGCYVGQEIIARMQTYGSASRRLIGLVCDGREIPKAQDPITTDGAPLGQITSACFSWDLQRPIALGYVKRPFYDQVGEHVEVTRASTPLRATLVRPPFIPPAG